MKKLLFCAGVGMLAAGVAVAQPEPGPRAERNLDLTREQAIERADRMFDRLDLNRDGRATPEEARQAAAQRHAERAGQLFDQLDANDDGNISRAEFDAARASRQQRVAERRGAHAGAAGQPGEMHRRHMAMRGPGAGPAGPGAPHAGQAGPGAGHAGPGPRMRMMRHHRAAMRAQHLFAGQESITREQMRARALERFARLDADRNGTVTAAERMQGRQHMRMERRAAPPAERN